MEKSCINYHVFMVTKKCHDKKMWKLFFPSSETIIVVIIYFSEKKKLKIIDIFHPVLSGFFRCHDMHSTIMLQKSDFLRLNRQ